MTHSRLTPVGAAGLQELDRHESAAIQGGVGGPAGLIIAGIATVGKWFIDNWKDVEEGYQSVCRSK